MIGVIVAMGSELSLVTSQMEGVERREDFYLGTLGSKQVVVAQSGIGKVCAALCTARMIERFSPECIINTGVAGGLDTSLRVMDIVVGRESLYHDTWCGDGNEWGQVQGLPARFVADKRLVEIAQRCSVDGVSIHTGVVCSGDRFITSRDELNEIKRLIPEVLSVDMESNAIAQTCYIYSTPFVSVRVISDTPGADDHAAQYENFWDEVPKKSFEVLKQIVDRAIRNS